MSMTVEPVKQARAPRVPYIVLLADPDPDVRSRIAASLGALGPHVATHAKDADELERIFFEQGPYDLVVCRSMLGTVSGLDVLAKARRRGRKASFIMYSSLDGPWLRVFVSDAEATVLSSRVVSLDGLAQLAKGVLDAKTPLSRRATDSTGLRSIRPPRREESVAPRIRIRSGRAESPCGAGSRRGGTRPGVSRSGIRRARARRPDAR